MWWPGMWRPGTWQRTAAAAPLNSSRAAAAYGVLRVASSHSATPFEQRLHPPRGLLPNLHGQLKGGVVKQRIRLHIAPAVREWVGQQQLHMTLEQGRLAAAALSPTPRNGRPTCEQRQQQQQQTSQQWQWQQRVQQKHCGMHLPQATPQLTTRATGYRTARRPVHFGWCAAPAPPFAGTACTHPTGRSGGKTCSRTRGPPLQ